MPHGVATGQQQGAKLGWMRMQSHLDAQAVTPHNIHCTGGAVRTSRSLVLGSLCLTTALVVTGCSALSALVNDDSDAEDIAAAASESLAISQSCDAITDALEDVSGDLQDTLTGIQDAATNAVVSELTADQIEQFQKLSTSAGAVASALGSVASQVYSDDLKPAVSNLQTSMEFYTDYFLDLAEQSSDLAAVDTAVSNAETAATSAATITEICVGD